MNSVNSSSISFMDGLKQIMRSGAPITERADKG